MAHPYTNMGSSVLVPILSRKLLALLPRWRMLRDEDPFDWDEDDEYEDWPLEDPLDVSRDADAGADKSELRTP